MKRKHPRIGQQHLRVVENAQETTGEKLGTFIIALSMLRDSGLGAHTVVWEDTETHEDKHISVAGLVKGLVEYATDIESAMGKDVFYTWLDGWLHASPDERKAMNDEAGLYPDDAE
jgi:hypothetical protein